MIYVEQIGKYLYILNTKIMENLLHIKSWSRKYIFGKPFTTVWSQ